MPNISVIIPVYNAAQFLRQCLDSVINQTHQSMQIICVNDGSKDASEFILQEYKERDPRIEVIYQENQGVAVARNVGLDLAKGDFVHFIDADDWIEPNAYEELLSYIDQELVDICVFHHRKYHNVNDVFHDAAWFSSDREKENFTFTENPRYFLYNSVVVWNKLYRRSFLEDNQIRFHPIPVGEDRIFYFTTIRLARNIKVINKVYMNYRIGVSTSISNTATARNFNYYKVAFLKSWEFFQDADQNIRDMFLDLSFIDFFNYYQRACKEDKREIAHDILEFFFTYSKYLDISNLKKYHKWYHQLLGLFLFYFNIKPTELDNGEKIEQATRKEINAIYQSWNYRVGSVVLYLPKKAYKIFKKILLIFETKKDNKPPQNGINREPRDREVVVSMTSFPPRINAVKSVLNSILTQTFKPDRVLVYLAKEQFEETGLPKWTKAYRAVGVNFIFCDDLKPHKKYFYTMQEHPDSIVITVDDDVVYPTDLIQTLYKAHLEHPNCVCAMRTHKIEFDHNHKPLPYEYWIHDYSGILNTPSMDLVPIGIGGVLYPPYSLHRDAFKKQEIIESCLFADDMWLKVMEMKQGTPAVLVRKSRLPICIPGTQEQALWKANVMDNKNDMYLNNILKNHPVF